MTQGGGEAVTRAGSGPVLAVVTDKPSGDGVGYVGQLLEKALAQICAAAPRIVALNRAAPGDAGPLRRAGFITRLAIAERSARHGPVVFNHLGIARAQRFVPPFLRRPYAVFLHGIEIWPPELAEDRKRAVRDAMVRFSNSAYTACRVAATHPDLGEIHPCPLALLPEIEEPDRDAREIARALLGPASGARVAIVGRMSAAERYKGHDELLDSWAAVRRAVPEAKLIVMGKGDDLPRLKSRAREQGVADAVLFTGFLPDAVMRAVLADCQVFAMPSRGEGFGLAYLEAMRVGLPCVGSTADGAVDVIVDGETGRLVPSNDRRALADALIALLQDSKAAKAMGALGRAREASVFSFDQFRIRVENALRSGKMI